MILISVETIRWISHTSRIIPENPPFFLPGIKTLFQQATGRMTSDQLQELFLRSWTIERDAGSQKAHKSNRKQRESQQKRFSLRAAMHHVKYPAAEMHFLTARYFSQSFLKKDAPLASKQAISSLPAMSAFLTHPPTSLRACSSYSMSERVSFDLPPPPTPHGSTAGFLISFLCFTLKGLRSRKWWFEVTITIICTVTNAIIWHIIMDHSNIAAILM